jgi:hypothetical protein
MARQHFERPIQDELGNLAQNASVRLLEPGTTTPITDTIYVANTGSAVRSNPWVAAGGVIDFYLNASRTVRIGVTTPGGIEVFFDDLLVGTPLDQTALDASVASLLGNAQSSTRAAALLLSPAPVLDSAKRVSVIQSRQFDAIGWDDFALRADGRLDAQPTLPSGQAYTFGYGSATGAALIVQSGELRLTTSGASYMMVDYGSDANIEGGSIEGYFEAGTTEIAGINLTFSKVSPANGPTGQAACSRTRSTPRSTAPRPTSGSSTPAPVSG